MKVALIVATPGEAGRLRELNAEVVVSGVGAVNAALATADLLRSSTPDLVASVGIGGAYPLSGLRLGDVAVSSEMIYGGLGAMDGEHFLDLEALGFPLLPGTYNRLAAWEGARDWAGQLSAAFGPFITLETVTGDARAARVLETRFPGALIEGMEGAGVAHVARRAGVPAVEVRAVSNFVGPRDRQAWRVPQALAALRAALERVL